MTHIALGFLSILVVASLCFFADTNSGISRNIRENEARNLVAVDSNEIVSAVYSIELPDSFIQSFIH